MHRLFHALLFAAVLVPAGARAADWTAVKLRGLVFANNVVGDAPWVRLRRGDIVDDARVIRTLGNGNVAFQSGDETIAFGPGTQAEIIDRGGRRYTTVSQQAGTVAISAEALEVQHFSVETPYLVAVVKGTVFSVTTGATGSGVSVSRGLVAVTDRQSREQVLLPAGRSMVVQAGGRSATWGQAIPALVHPTVDGVVEDADPAAVAAVPATPERSAPRAPDVSGIAGSGIGPAIGGSSAGIGSGLGALGPGIGDVGGTAGTAIGGIGNAVTGVGQTTGTVGAALGGGVGRLGGNLGGLGAVTGGVGSTLGSATTTVGTAVSGVGAAVTSLGATVKATSPGSGSSGLGGLTGSVTGAVGGALSHLGL